MQIREFARLCGLSSHTLRYYEKIGLLPPVDRTDSNHRRYTEQDRLWIEFVKRLKATNMPLAEIQHYARLRAQGTATEQERMALLEAHARRLEQAIAQEQEHLVSLREKICWYQAQIGRSNSLDLECAQSCRLGPDERIGTGHGGRRGAVSKRRPRP